jgi:membrane protease YdiL (CAAX protease family)
MRERPSAGAALGVVVGWTLGSRHALRLLHHRPPTLASAVSGQIAGNLVAAAIGAAFLANTPGHLGQFIHRPGRKDAAAIALGVAISAPGSALLANRVGRKIAPIEREIRGLPLGRKLVVLGLVPLTEELLWRGVTVSGLSVLGVPFRWAVGLSVALSIAAHGNAFEARELVLGVGPSSAGTAVTYLLTRSLGTAIAVHLAADFEILLPLVD